MLVYVKIADQLWTLEAKKQILKKTKILTRLFGKIAKSNLATEN
jgi:hypothetical protein